MDSKSKGANESSLRQTSEIRLTRWEYQKVIKQGCQENSALLDSVTHNFGEKHRPKRIKTWLLGTK